MMIEVTCATCASTCHVIHLCRIRFMMIWSSSPQRIIGTVQYVISKTETSALAGTPMGGQGMLRLFSIILILTALSSCGSNSPPIELEKAVSDSLPTLPDTWSSAIESVGDVKVGWIKQIGDPTLTELVAEAQQNNRNLQVAAANVERSWSLADQAGASLTPTVTLASESERVASPEGGSQVRRSAGLQANWELDVWGRIRSGNQAAISSAQSAQADYIFSQNSLAAAVARGYFLAIESNRQVAVTQMDT